MENTTESCKIISDVERVDRSQQFTASSHTRTTSEAAGSQLKKELGGSLWPHTYGAVDLQSSLRDDPVKAKNR